MTTLGARSAQPPRSRVATATRHLRGWLQPQLSIGAREQRDQAVLLLAVAVVVAPHFEHLPLWSVVAIGVVWIWRAWLTQTLKPGPGRMTMVVLLVAGTAAVWLEHGTLIGRDAGVNFLLVLIGLKLLEMRAHRDVLVIVFLSLFVLETQFLFDQSLATAAVMAVSITMLFFVLLSVNLPEGDISFGGKMGYLARVFFLALPLALALFFLFPRLSAPIWRVAGDEAHSGTGLSGAMSPGSISHLQGNDAVALRARFEGRVPAQRDLYWRGPVFGRFDGRTWTALTDLPQRPAEIQYVASSAVDYLVTLEPTERHELIALELAAVVDNVPTTMTTARLTPTLEVLSAAPIVSRLRYRVRSYTRFAAGPRSADPSLGPWLALPAEGNPRTRQWAAQLRAGVLADGARTGARAPLDQRLVEAVLLEFRRQPFRYNVDVPVLGRDPVDGFLFDTRVGYCEHYASSFVVLMRAMGVPARVVTGYQGGEINPVDGYLTVRQSDAHAWAEVWLDHRGWQRVDPTAAVAPERIERTLQDRRTEGLGGSRAGGNWLAALRLNREALENAWNQWFLSYSAERQRALMTWIGLRPDIESVSAVAVAAVSALLVGMAVLSLRRSVRRDPLAELESSLRQKLQRAGVGVPLTMGLHDMHEHLRTRLAPPCQADLQDLLAGLQAERYARPVRGGRRERLRALRRSLGRWRPQRAPVSP